MAKHSTYQPPRIETRRGRPVIAERAHVTGLGLVEVYSYPSGHVSTWLNEQRAPKTRGDSDG